MQLVLPSISNFRRISGGFRSRTGQRLLPVRTVLGYRSGNETIVRCLKGRIWITDGRAGDFILFPGEKFTGGGGSKIVIEALEESVVDVHG